MADRPRLDLALKELDREFLGQDMPLGARNRVGAALRENLRASRRPRRWLPMLSFVGGAALVLLVLAVGPWWSVSAPASEVATPTPSIGVFSVEGERCRIQTPAEHKVDAYRLTGECRMVARHMTVSTWQPTRLRVDGYAVHIDDGRAVFDVRKVRPGAPSVEVLVSGGTIEVVGTRFEVQQSDGGGHVDLFEGKIRFHASNGDVTQIQPGSRHAWGNEVEVPPAVEASVVVEDAAAVEDAAVEPVTDVPRAKRPQPRRLAGRKDEPSSRSARDAAEIIARVDVLRRAGRNAEAAALLRRAVAQRWDRRTAQVLSYELGEFLHRHADDREAACDHFAEHQKRFSGGRYRSAVARRMSSLGCARRGTPGAR